MGCASSSKAVDFMIIYSIHVRPEVCYHIHRHAMTSLSRRGSGTGSVCRNMIVRALIGPALLLLTGCQSMPILGWSDTAAETTPVMTLWQTYEHCRATGDVGAKQSDARDLAAAARQANVVQPSPIPLPRLIQRHVQETEPRYSVDLRALSASCSLEAGHAALQAGQHNVAADSFQFVLVTYPQTEYEYYSRQARRGLQQIELKRLVSLPAEPHMLPVSAR